MCTHNHKSLKKTQSFFMAKPFGDELKTIFIFGLNEKTLEESQLVFEKYGGQSQIFSKHCKVRFATWFDAELALSRLKRESLTIGFSFCYKKLKHQHLKLIEKLKQDKNSTSSVFIKTDIWEDGGKNDDQQNANQTFNTIYLHNLPLNVRRKELQILSSDIKEITLPRSLKVKHLSKNNLK